MDTIGAFTRGQLEEIVDNLLSGIKRSTETAGISRKEQPNDPTKLSPAYLSDKIESLIDPEITHYTAVYPELGIAARLESVKTTALGYVQQLYESGRASRRADNFMFSRNLLCGAIIGAAIPIVYEVIQYITQADVGLPPLHETATLTGFFIVLGALVGVFVYEATTSKATKEYRHLCDEVKTKLIDAFYS